jgi:DNA-binding SARP family transcriptional activator
MRVYAALGNRSAIIHQYEHLQHALLDEVGVAPSPQTEILYNQLIH